MKQLHLSVPISIKYVSIFAKEQQSDLGYNHSGVSSTLIVLAFGFVIVHC